MGAHQNTLGEISFNREGGKKEREEGRKKKGERERERKKPNAYKNGKRRFIT